MNTNHRCILPCVGSRVSRAVFVIVGSVLCPFAVVAQPQTPAAEGDATASTRETTAQRLSSSASLENETVLAAKVSLEAKRRPLREVLADVSKQSGVAITMAEKAPAASLVTMRVREMPLRDLMAALSRVYGVSWSKNADGGFAMQPSTLSSLQMKLLQMGHPYFYRFSSKVSFAEDQKRQKLRKLAQDILAHIDQEALRSPQGASVTSLPADLQRRLRDVYEKEYATYIVSGYYAAFRHPLPADSKVKITLPAVVTDPSQPVDEQQSLAFLNSALEVTSSDGERLFVKVPLLPPKRQGGVFSTQPDGTRVQVDPE